MLRSILLVALIACGAPVQPALDNHVAAPAGAQPAPLYAKLFAGKSSIQLPYEVQWSTAPRQAKGIATCWIAPAPVPAAASSTAASRWATSIDCGSNTDDDGGMIADWLALPLVATDAGLWRSPSAEHAGAPDAAALAPADMLIGATPRASARDVQLRGGEDPIDAVRHVLAFEGGWCVRDDGPQVTTLCFANGLLSGAARVDREAGSSIFVGAVPR